MADVPYTILGDLEAGRPRRRGGPSSAPGSGTRTRTEPDSALRFLTLRISYCIRTLLHLLLYKYRTAIRATANDHHANDATCGSDRTASVRQTPWYSTHRENGATYRRATGTNGIAQPRSRTPTRGDCTAPDPTAPRLPFVSTARIGITEMRERGRDVKAALAVNSRRVQHNAPFRRAVGSGRNARGLQRRLECRFDGSLKLAERNLVHLLSHFTVVRAQLHEHLAHRLCTEKAFTFNVFDAKEGFHLCTPWQKEGIEPSKGACQGDGR